MAWYEWAQPDLPCFFAPDRARSNSDFLQETLGTRFWERKSRSNPMLTLWDEKNPHAFLQLNALAEDLRLVAHKPGSAILLSDLRSRNAQESARHTVHTAALFERARVGSLVRFVEARNDTVPDYLVNLDGTAVAVEAKLVVTSTIEQAFGKVAMPEINRCIEALQGRPLQYFIVAVARDATAPPAPGSVAEVVAGLPSRAGVYEGDFPGFKFWAEASLGLGQFTEHREIHLIAPVHEKDHLRLKGPAKQASKQLRALPEAPASGILALGLARMHQPETVNAILGNEMRQGNFKGIAAVLLIKQGSHLAAPRRTVIDALEVRRNPAATHPIICQVPLRPIDLGVKLSEAEPPVLEKPAYVCAVTQGRVTNTAGGAALGLRRLDRIPRGMI
ncbi:MAG: hypothetical protein ABI645_13790 [Pseudomonadota bacterium]